MRSSAPSICTSIWRR